MVLIGLGTAGSEIVNCFSDSHEKIIITSKDFPNCKTEEEFEEKCPKFRNLTKKIKDECWFFVCGGSKCASATLRILETIKNKKINLVYICPDSDLSGPTVMKRHKVIYNVLQQYTRSGLIHSMCIISNKQVLRVIGDQPINKLYNSINTMVANTIETIMWFRTQEPVMGSLHEQKQISRIYTVSIGNIKNNEENLLFLLDNPTETWYIYSISKHQLENNKDLIPLIRSRVIEDEENEINSSFTIYPSEHKQSYFYSLKYTHFIQPMETN
jgi:hypothetical protein